MPTFSAGHGILSRGTEFVLFRGILIFPRNFANKGGEKLAISMIFGLMPQLHSQNVMEKLKLNCLKLWAISIATIDVMNVYDRSTTKSYKANVTQLDRLHF